MDVGGDWVYMEMCVWEWVLFLVAAIGVAGEVGRYHSEWDAVQISFLRVATLFIPALYSMRPLLRRNADVKFLVLRVKAY